MTRPGRNVYKRFVYRTIYQNTCRRGHRITTPFGVLGRSLGVSNENEKQEEIESYLRLDGTGDEDGPEQRLVRQNGFNVDPSLGIFSNQN